MIKTAIILNAVFMVWFVLTGLWMVLVGQSPLLGFFMSVVFMGVLIGPALRVLTSPTSKLLQVFVFLTNAGFLCIVVYVIVSYEESGWILMMVAAIHIAIFVPFILNAFISAKLLVGKMQV